MRVAVAGASGFIGRAVSRRLERDGHHVRALTRHPDHYCGPGQPVSADIDDPASLSPALEGCDFAYYLVHSLAHDDFVARDRMGATAFAAAAAGHGLTQVIYLGGLGNDLDALSPHLRSRREVETILRGSAPTTALRAGIVIGDGGTSWEILRQLVERLPVMIAPRWVETRTQPIALADAVEDLVGVLDRPGCIDEIYEIGGPAALTYRQMMIVVSQILGRHRLIVPVPLLSPGLSAHWLRLITDVDTATARALVDSLTNEVVVHEARLDRLLGRSSMSFEKATLQALAARADRLAAGRRVVA